MKRIIASLCLLLLLCFGMSAKETSKELVLPLPKMTIPGSLYRQITVLDTLGDTPTYGTVRLGAVNRVVPVVASIPLKQQVADVVTGMAGLDAGDGELLLLLRNYSFSEASYINGEKGFCALRASLFVKSSQKYQIISSIDTLVSTYAMEVSDSILKLGGLCLSEFLYKNITKQPLDTTHFSISDIQQWDEIEKNKIPLYAASKFTDGLYLSYASFSQQVPDKQVNVEFKKDKIDRVETIEDKPDKVKSGESYALVVGGKAYLAVEKDYFALRKEKNDFVCIARFSAQSDALVQSAVSVLPQGTAMSVAQFGVAAGFAGGAAGALVGMAIVSAIGDTQVYCEVKIDHLSGSFIKIREFKKKPKEDARTD